MNLRIVFVIVLGLLEIVGAAVSFATYDQPIGQYGWILANDNETVDAVLPGTPAAEAGMQRGDRIVYASLPLRGRRRVIFGEEVPAGAPIHFSVTRGTHEIQMTLVATPIPGDYSRAVTLAYAISGLALGLVSLALLLLRPSWMTWGFVWIAPVMLIPYPLAFWAQSSESFAAAAFDVAVALLYALQTTGILIFASRFPDDRPRGFAQFVDRIAVPAGIVVAVLYLYAYLTVRFTQQPPANFVTLANYSVLVPSVAAVVCLISTYVTTRGSTRTRLAPVIASLFLMIVAETLSQIGGEISESVGFNIAVNLLYALAPAAVAVAVAYGVVRHRVIDVNFFISRTLVYTTMTVMIVAVFALIEYVVGKLLEERQLAQFLEVVAAVGVGISMNYLHGWLDRVLDVVFFRKRHEAEQRLARAARTMPHANASKTVDRMLADEPFEALELASAAVFRRDDGRYVRTYAKGWEGNTAGELDPDDRLVVRMRAELSPVAIDEPKWKRDDVPRGEAGPVFAVPVATGNELEAIAIYGAHASGEDIDPDERRSLVSLASAAALAYDHIAKDELRRTVEQLTVENRALERVESKLSALLGKP